MIKILNFIKTLLSHESPVSSDGTADCLVGVVRNTHQLEVNLAKNFYHVPARFVYELDMPIKYIALYTSASGFGKESAGILRYGKITSLRSIPRYQITEIPKDSPEPYFVFYVEDWIPLEHPVRPLETAQIVTMTSLELIKKSEYMPELYMRSHEEFAFFQFLKAICITGADRKKYNFNGTKIAASGDTIEIIFRDGEHQKLSRDIYKNRPFALYRKIMLKNK